jgi:hypothetical protein
MKRRETLSCKVQIINKKSAEGMSRKINDNDSARILTTKRKIIIIILF